MNRRGRNTKQAALEPALGRNGPNQADQHRQQGDGLKRGLASGPLAWPSVEQVLQGFALVIAEIGPATTDPHAPAAATEALLPQGQRGQPPLGPEQRFGKGHGAGAPALAGAGHSQLHTLLTDRQDARRPYAIGRSHPHRRSPKREPGNGVVLPAVGAGADRDQQAGRDQGRPTKPERLAAGTEGARTGDQQGQVDDLEAQQRQQGKQQPPAGARAGPGADRFRGDHEALGFAGDRTEHGADQRHQENPAVELGKQGVAGSAAEPAHQQQLAQVEGQGHRQQPVALHQDWRLPQQAEAERHQQEQ